MRYVILLESILLVGIILTGCGLEPSLHADAGLDYSIQVGEVPTFDGCASSGEIVNYRWKIVDAPEQVSYDDGKVIRQIDTFCSFEATTAMIEQEVGQWEIELEVRDSAGTVAYDTVTVTVLE